MYNKRFFWAEFAAASLCGMEAVGTDIGHDELAKLAANAADALMSEMEERDFPDEALELIGSETRSKRSAGEAPLPPQPPRGLERYGVAETLGLNIRSANCLVNARIYSLADLVRYTPRKLLRVKNFGRISLAEVESALKRKGLSLEPGSG